MSDIIICIKNAEKICNKENVGDYNLIRDVCDILGYGYDTLANHIGYSESSIRSSASTGKISKQLAKAIELHLTIIKLTKEVSAANIVKQHILEWIKSE